MKLLLARVAVALALVVPAAAQQDIFPLAKGTMWTYEGTVRWDWAAVAHTRGEAKSYEDNSKNIQWRMEVVDIARGPGFHVALIEGAPWELAWYDPVRTVPSKHVILVVDDTTYLFDCLPGADVFATLKEKGLTEELRDLLPDHIWYREPIVPDGLYCAPEQKDRHDRMYCWAVDEVKKKRIAGVAGLDASERQIVTLALRTLPDHQFVDFVPGIGIIRYSFGHHGTLSEADVHLVEFHRGESTP